MGTLVSELSAAFADAFTDLGLDPKFGEVRASDKADFQCNGALAAAKSAKRNPREIATEIVEQVSGHEAIASLDIAGPGFINVTVSDAALSELAEEVRLSDMAGAEQVAHSEKIVLDFGGANVAKPMHVGHIRTAIIGDTLQRIFRFVGDDVTSDVHLGDWGLQMGHLITELQDEQPDLPYFDSQNKGPFPEESPVSIEDLSRLYPQASAKAKEDPDRNARSQAAVAELQAGRAGYRALLDHFVAVSIEELKVDYGFLGVSFDLWKGEKDVEPLIPDMVADLKEKGFAKEDDGAWIIPVEREGDTKEYPPFILVNSRGASLYHTSDLATILDRIQTHSPDRIIYVVDQRQALHFEQVFRASGIVGYMAEDRLEHIGFGTVNGTDGKPFKTREG
ncbi:MAG: arginine--tRNA ligase, partial [Pseudomonadota bacterium]